MSKNEKTPELEPIPKGIMNIAWILVLGAVMPLLDSTMVNIAIKHLSSDFSIGLDLTYISENSPTSKVVG